MEISDPVTEVPLVGRRYSSRLDKLGIKTIEDLINHYPFRYDDFSKIVKIAHLTADETATIVGKIEEIKLIFTRNRKKLVKGIVSDETGKLPIVWFNQPYIVRNIKKGDTISLSGKLTLVDNKAGLISPEYEIVQRRDVQLNVSQPGIHTGRLVPIYPETSGISSKWLRSKINTTLKLISDIEDPLPSEIKKSRGLINLNEAIRDAHFPKSQSDIEISRHRLAFDELFYMQLIAKFRKADWQSNKPCHHIDVSIHKHSLDEFIRSLPFQLTNAQKRCVEEILSDLEKDRPMSRLLEGDVGSGKTIVATLAILSVFLSYAKSRPKNIKTSSFHNMCNDRYNACDKPKILYMAPTEILANQQYESLRSYLGPIGVKIGLLTGSQKKIPEDWDLVVGTHAILYNQQNLDDVALVVIDEQHRFGVEQRAKLLSLNRNGKIPHLLTMTATPIPRSLALTIYGDLDLSVIDEMPPGRKEIRTWYVPSFKRNAACDWIKKQIAQGDQVFWICPLIEESEIETMKSIRAVKKEFERLSKEVFPNLKLGLLHGRMKAKEKDKIILDFRDKKLDILVSTPVVEVGIDIPNATIMIIETAERFGLASLHQLRGRVGRGERQSYCLLFSDIALGRVPTRLRAMEKYQDGIKLSEIDLKLRGPGEIFGLSQHGFLKLKIANLSDIRLLKETKEEAERVAKNLDSYPQIKRKIEDRSANVEPN